MKSGGSTITRRAIAISAAAALAIGHPQLLRAEEQAIRIPPNYSLVQEETNRAGANLQMGEMLREDTKRIEVNMVAVPQNGASTVSLINGLGDNNVWYQYGLICGRGNNFSVGFQIWTNGVPMFSPRKIKGLDIKPYYIVKLTMQAEQGRIVMSVATPAEVSYAGGQFAIGPCPSDAQVKNGISISVKSSATMFKGFDSALEAQKGPWNQNRTLVGYSSVFSEVGADDLKGFTWQVYQVKCPRPSAEPIFFAPPNSGKSQTFSTLHKDKMRKLETGEYPSLQLGGTNGIIRIADPDQFAAVGPKNTLSVSFLPREGIP